MSDWTSGYVTEINYSYGYYANLNPLRIKLAFLHAGLDFPTVGAACELGFGQGVSINLHASASTIQWFGTDFNPSQVLFANELSKVSAANLYDDSFVDFCKRTDLPSFDYIGIHGVWSWISEENRQVIIEFLRKKLKVGGVFYISYNTMPGWGTIAPLRHLMTQYQHNCGVSGNAIATEINNTFKFIDSLLATKPNWANSNPEVLRSFKQIEGKDRCYLAHEYFNQDWNPVYFSEMAESMQKAKLSFACSAQYTDLIASVNLSRDQKVFLDGISDINFQQTIYDFVVNKKFRQDYWIKGRRSLTNQERDDCLRRQWVVLIVKRSEVTLKVRGALGELKISPEIYHPILEELNENSPRSLGSLEQSLARKGLKLYAIANAISLLIGMDYVAPANEPNITDGLKKKTYSMNSLLISSAETNNNVRYLASPVIGGGIRVGYIQQLFLLSRSKGGETPDDWAKTAWDILCSRRQKVIKAGRTLQTDQENLDELLELATRFSEQRLPVLIALQVVD